MTEKILIGASEKVKINSHEYIGKIDTGAESSSICKSIAEELDLKEPVKRVIVKSANGEKRRNVYELEVEIKGKKIKAFFNVADRRRLKYKILLGMNVLKDNFLIDPSLEYI